ncbi:MAG: lysoplasmalogenase [Polyangiaceae bacterium]
MTGLVAGLLWILWRGPAWLEWVLKPLAAATFVMAATSGAPWSGGARFVLWVGLVLAAVGDVLLIPKSKRAFLGGLVAFLLGHVAYAAAFAVMGVAVGVTIGVFAVAAAAAVFVLRWLAPHVEGPMRGPVRAYIAVITAMVALAAGAAAASGDLRILVGAVMFYLSDLSVARDRFVRRGFVNRLWGLPLYFFAQLVLAAVARSAYE